MQPNSLLSVSSALALSSASSRTLHFMRVCSASRGARYTHTLDSAFCAVHYGVRIKRPTLYPRRARELLEAYGTSQLFAQSFDFQSRGRTHYTGVSSHAHRWPLPQGIFRSYLMRSL